MKRRSIYIITVLFSILFLFFANKIAIGNAKSFENGMDNECQKAEVIKILQRSIKNYGQEEAQEVKSIKFSAKILSGDKKGQTVTALQNSSEGLANGIKEVNEGDKLLIMKSKSQEKIDWIAGDYIRTDSLAVLAIIFFIFLIIFGKSKGFNTIVSLIFTCAAIFFVFIPAVLSGKNIYFWSILVCIFIITMSFLIVNGPNKKCLIAALGCLGGVLVSSILTAIMSPILKLSGLVNEESMFLLYLNEKQPIDLKAIIFAAILIGAIGAIMDVSMSISSSLYEVCENNKEISFLSIFKSGLSIGRDIMGTMCNTLILAYIGGSLAIVLLLTAYNTSMLQLLNSEMVVVEILQALVGSLGVLFTIPLTSIISAAVYPRSNNKVNKIQAK